MKKTLLVLCLAFAALSAFAQIPKGTSTLGGTVGFSYAYEDYPSSLSIRSRTGYVMPEYGYFVIDNLCVGANVSASLSGSTREANYYSKKHHSSSRGLAVGPFVQYYLPAGKDFYITLSTGYRWGQTTVKSEYELDYNEIETDEYKTGTSTFDASAGIAYFMTPHTALMVAIGYTNVYYKNREEDAKINSTAQIGLNAGLRIFLRKE